MILQRKVTTRNGLTNTHHYHTIRGVDVNKYFRDKMRSRYVRKRAPTVLPENFAHQVVELHDQGHSQRDICTMLNCNRYQVQKVLGSRNI
jgi:hypothetical protein